MQTAEAHASDFGSVTIRLASPEDIRAWSYGEVRKPETINYRTYRPEKDGLFCERIFGPERDWECFCGKYKGIKHKGIVCDKCAVLITHSRVRRERMGHISLAAPVAHIWFFKSLPSRMKDLLGSPGLCYDDWDTVKTSSLERVIYFQDYLVVDPGDTDLMGGQLLSEEEYRSARAQFGDEFDAGMGAETVARGLRKLDLDRLCHDLRQKLRETRSKQTTKTLIKHLTTVEMLKESNNRAEWMILDVIPVLPPDLRPLVLLDSGNFATSDLNDLYRRLINRNNRLQKLLDLNAPEVIIRNEKRMLQQSVDALFDNGRCRRPVLGSSNRPLKSLTDMIKGKQGRFRENLLGKRVDYSARSVIVVGPELKLHQVGLPKPIALELYQPFIIRKLKERALAETIKSAKKMLERRDEEVWDILDEVIQGHPVLINRAPTLHRMGIQAFEPVLVEGNAIRIHPLVCAGYNADFDGDQVAVHLPLSYEAQIESASLMLATNNVFSPANGQPIMAPTQDIVLGLYYLSKERAEFKVQGRTYAGLDELFLAYGQGVLQTHDRVRVRFPEGAVVRYGKDRRNSVECSSSTLVIRDAGGDADLKAIVAAAKKARRIPVVDRDAVAKHLKGKPKSGAPKFESSRNHETTIGRAILNDVLPEGMPFYNYELDKRGIGQIIAECDELAGREATLGLLDGLKALGFKAATRAGLSFGQMDMRIPAEKAKILTVSDKAVTKVEADFEKGKITDNERYLKIVDIWFNAREEVGAAMMEGMRDFRDPDDDRHVNPIYCMASSGARGSMDQVRQLAGMRGLMAKPGGEIIEAPIKANFREGLHVLEYFSSTHGARKGLADTALKTADSGYLTRKLADVAHNLVVIEDDCGTPNGIEKTEVRRGDLVISRLGESIVGRTSLNTIVGTDHYLDEVLVEKDQIITADTAEKIVEEQFPSVFVRSPLTCESPHGVCATCYGMDLSRGRQVERGLAVGIIAAQSIGEPGTQLTMRTFHIGGTASRSVEDNSLSAERPGKASFSDKLNVVRNRRGIDVVLSRNGTISILDKKGRTLETHPVPVGAVMKVTDGSAVKGGGVLLEWDAHHTPILAEVDGVVVLEDIIEDQTLKTELDAKTKIERRVIIEHKGELHPQIKIVDKKGDTLALYPIPEKAYLEVVEGESVVPGTLMAKTPREIGGTQDITGGLPRVTELFEARIPRDPAIMAEIDGVVELGDKKRGKRTIIVKNEEADVQVQHMVPQGKHLRVHTGDIVRAGDPLVDGALVPHDILKIKGEWEVHRYLLAEILAVYRGQGVSIDDKHVEVIVSQMMRKVEVKDPGDTSFLPGAIVDKFQVRTESESVVERTFEDAEDGTTRKGRPAQTESLLMGITKAALRSESFISAASFQETTKVLTEASLGGRRDPLVGLKENVILGNLVPTGTGFSEWRTGEVGKDMDALMAIEARAMREEEEQSEVPAEAAAL